MFVNNGVADIQRHSYMLAYNCNLGEDACCGYTSCKKTNHLLRNCRLFLVRTDTRSASCGLRAFALATPTTTIVWLPPGGFLELASSSRKRDILWICGLSMVFNHLGAVTVRTQLHPVALTYEHTKLSNVSPRRYAL